MTSAVQQQTLKQLSPVLSRQPEDCMSGQTEQQYFYFPYLLRNFPWDRGFNSHYERGRAESNAWLQSLHPFTEKGQQIFNGWDFPYLAAVAYHGGSYFTFRSICDVTNVFFLIDEQTDNQPIEIVQQRCAMALDAVLHPHKPRPHNEASVIGEATRQCWARASTELPRVIIERFESTWKSYLDSVVRQAQNRHRKHKLDPSAYLRERVDNIGIPPSVALGEQCKQLAIPHECLAHRYLTDMMAWCSELVTLQNDLFSYRKERLAGDCEYNAVALVMHHQGVSLDEAVRWVAERHEATLCKFWQTRQKVLAKDGFPSYGAELDRQIAEYTGVIADWVRGNYEWSWVSQRYFPGGMGKEARATRKIYL